MKSFPTLSKQTGKWISSMDFYIWGIFWRHVTKTWRMSSNHLGSMGLARAWRSGAISLPLYSCVSGANPIFSMSSIQSYVGLPWFLGWACSIEGKDKPAQIGSNIHLELGRTVGLLLWMREPLFSTGKYAVMDTGFLLKMGLLHLRHRECMPVLESVGINSN